MFRGKHLILHPTAGSGACKVLVCHGRCITQRNTAGYTGKAKLRPNDGEMINEVGSCMFQIPIRKSSIKGAQEVWLVKSTKAFPVCLRHTNCSGTPYLTAKQVANLQAFKTVTNSDPKQFKRAAQKALSEVGASSVGTTKIVRAKKITEGNPEDKLTKSLQMLVPYAEKFNELPGNGRMVVHTDAYNKTEIYHKLCRQESIRRSA